MLISAIMPTADRAAYIPLALDCFLRQTWQEKELVVIDDGAQNIAPLFAGLPRVHYFRFSKRTLGEKRNIGVSLALGDVVIHWDDDDWSAPTRMQDQAESLLLSRKAVTGYHQLLYWDVDRQSAFRYRYQGPMPYATGTSQCYVRSWALIHPFPAKSWGEDTDFSHAAAAAGQLTSWDDRKLMVARKHCKSTGSPPLGNNRGFPAVATSEIPAEFFADVARVESGVAV